MPTNDTSAPPLQQEKSATFNPPRPTGRRLVMFDSSIPSADARRLLAEDGDGPVVSTSAAESMAQTLSRSSAGNGILLLERFSIAVVGGGAQRAATIASSLAARDEVVDTRPEFWLFAAAGPPWQDSAASTWGVEAIGAADSQYDGSGIRIAVLDTGIDANHPDFRGRTIVSQSFVEGEAVDDLQGHGTHCAGTAAGRVLPGGNVPRYGVAPGADLYVAKVLNNRGAGRELDIMAGMEWALSQECSIISMSLERPVAEDEQHDPFYEAVGLRAMESGCLIVAAAGNQSDRRYGYVAPVSSPASAPSIMAVAAIGSDEGIASFSCGSTGLGEVDIAAPGVSIFSSVAGPQIYRKLPGTSMACPHVAGVAALWAQSDPALRGPALWRAITGRARPLGALSQRDVGSGLVSAP